MLTGAAAVSLSRVLRSASAKSGNFPASIKTVAEWFPKKERALATGIFNSGTNVGALVTPLVVPWIVLDVGAGSWAFVIDRSARLSAGSCCGYRFTARPQEHPRLSKRNWPTSAATRPIPQVHIPWLKLLPHRQTWAFAIGKFMTDPVWWLYLFWVPDFLNKNHGLKVTAIGLPLVVIYLVADVGSIGGGWLSSRLIKRGWTLNAARKTAMLICALCVVPMVFAAKVSNLWVAVCDCRVSLLPRTRAGRPTSSRSPPTCSRARRSAR